MSQVNTEKTFDELEIRDTNDHNGATINLYNFRLKTIIIENDLNQEVTFQCQASAHSDFSNTIDVGSTWAVTANTNSFQTCDSFFPYMRLVASCASAPTTGDLTVYMVEYQD